MRLGFGELVLYVGTLAVISTAALQMFLASVATMAGQLEPRLLEPREVSRDEVKAATTGKPWSPDSLLWAAQVTDLHISQFRGRPERSKGLSSLCSFLKRRVRPSVALLTGDIVDAKDYKLFGSTQYKEEWEEYAEAMRECSPDFPWLDIRGNHDAFDVQGEEHNSNMFNRYSVQGPRHERSYLEVVEQKQQQQRTQTSAGGLSLCLVGVDATPSPGLKRLFNFFGILTQEEVNSVTALLDEADHRCNHTVTFGHYPSSSVSAYGDKDLRHLLSNRLYLCGHYHTGYGYFPHMYTRHPTGMLELELGDWKDYRMYRLFAFDNGVFSFSDFDFSSPTPHIAAVVTSPRPARFAADSSSSSGIDSSIGPTIRALVFADESIESVSVLLPSSLKEEGSPIVLDMEKSSNVTPLYEASWPSGYLDSRRSGLHRLTVLVALKSGHTSEFYNDYSLDGSQRPYEFWADVILLSDWLPVSALAFAFATFAVVGSIAAARILRHALVTGIEVGEEEEEDLLAKKKDQVSSNGVAVKSSSKCKSGTYPFLFRAPLRNFCLISCCDRIARPIILASLYACFLPWCFGRVLGDRLALVSAWGVLLLDDLTLLSPDMAFIVGILWHATTTFPLLAVLSNAAGRALKRERSKRTDPPPPKLSLLTPLRFLWRHLGIAVILGMLAHNCFVLWWMYGAVSVLSPWGVGRLWLAACTYRRANGMRRRDFQAIGIRV